MKPIVILSLGLLIGLASSCSKSNTCYHCDFPYGDWEVFCEDQYSKKEFKRLVKSYRNMGAVCTETTN